MTPLKQFFVGSQILVNDPKSFYYGRRATVETVWNGGQYATVAVPGKHGTITFGLSLDKAAE